MIIFYLKLRKKKKQNDSVQNNKNKLISRLLKKF